MKMPQAAPYVLSYMDGTVQKFLSRVIPGTENAVVRWAEMPPEKSLRFQSPDRAKALLVAIFDGDNWQRYGFKVLRLVELPPPRYTLPPRYTVEAVP